MTAGAPRLGGRWAAFSAVGLLGFVLQMLTFSLLVRAGCPYAAATALAVLAAVAHNFCWHVLWTWRDRRLKGPDVVASAVRFVATNGTISLLGNVAAVTLFIHLHVPAVAAAALAVGLCSIANFATAHVIVFRASGGHCHAAPRKWTRGRVRSACLSVLALAASGTTLLAAEVPAGAAADFAQYSAAVDARRTREATRQNAALRIDRRPPADARSAYERLRRGEIVVERVDCHAEAPTLRFADALCHDWVGTALIPDVPLDRVLRLMQSYDAYSRVYAPAVRASRLVARDGDRFVANLQLTMKKVITVVLNTRNEVRYTPLGTSRARVRSVATRIAEVAGAGVASERELAPADEHGFLWRFENDCLLDARGDGTYVECETVSLSRDVPFGLGWLVGPFVTAIPRESLEFTLAAMRRALIGG